MKSDFVKLLVSVISVCFLFACSGKEEKSQTASPKENIKSGAIHKESQQEVEPITSDDCIVAKVADEQIRLSDILKKTKLMEKNLVLVGNKTREELVKEIRDRELNKLLEMKVVVKEANLRKVEAPADRGKLIIEDAKRRFGGDEKFADYLKSQEMTEEQYISEQTDLMKAGMFMQQFIERDVNISEEDLQKYYEDNKLSKFRVPEMLEVRRIEIKEKKERDLEQCGDLIAKLRTELLEKFKTTDSLTTKQEIFADYARKYSDCPNAHGGGLVVLYGPDAKGELDQSFVDAAFATEIGDISEPHQIKNTGNGYCIVTVESKNPAVQKTYEESKQQIEAIIKKERREKARNNLIADLKMKFNVSVDEKCLLKGIY